MTDQLDEREVVLYDDVPIGARWAGWLLLGIGGLVLTPAALVARYGWLLVVATPFLGCGVCLLQTRMRIAVDRRTLLVRVRYQLLRIGLSERRFTPSDLVGVEIPRVAGDELERDSDTWYIRLVFHSRAYTVGRYGEHLDALQARRDLVNQLSLLQATSFGSEEAQRRVEGQLHQAPDSPQSHYQLGLALMRTGDRAGARRAFQEALALSADRPVLARMVQQRIDELERS